MIINFFFHFQVQFIRGIGGASIQLAIQKAWKEILTNRAAMGMNFYGNKRKEEKKHGIGKRRTSILLRGKYFFSLYIDVFSNLFIYFYN